MLIQQAGVITAKQLSLCFSLSLTPARFSSPLFLSPSIPLSSPFFPSTPSLSLTISLFLSLYQYFLRLSLSLSLSVPGSAWHLNPLTEAVNADQAATAAAAAAPTGPLST